MVFRSLSVSLKTDLPILKSLKMHTKLVGFSVDGKSASLMHHALMRIDESSMSDLITDQIELILLNVMRNLDKQLISSIVSDDEETELLLNKREKNRFRNSIDVLSKINRINLPPAQAWMPLLVRFFLLNEQLVCEITPSVSLVRTIFV